MSYNKEYAIAAQNAATAAATLLQGTGASLDTYNDVRTAIFNGTLSLAGAESVVVAFEGEGYGDVPVQAVSATEAVQQATAPGGPHELDNFTVNSGKYSGKTFAQIRVENPTWFEWAATNLKNEFVAKRAAQYARHLAA